MNSKWKTEAPENFTGTCLITMQVKNRIWVTLGWADRNDSGELVMVKGAVAWMPLPEHASKNPEGWLSQYRGDFFPSGEDWYLVSMMHDAPNNHLPYMVNKLWFNSKTLQFGGSDNFIAWMPLPKPYRYSEVTK
jgi:hypothetical protein